MNFNGQAFWQLAQLACRPCQLTAALDHCAIMSLSGNMPNHSWPARGHSYYHDRDHDVTVRTWQERVRSTLQMPTVGSCT